MTSLRLDQLLREGVSYLRRQEVDSPELSAEILLAHAGGIKRLDVLVRPEWELEDRAVRVYRHLIRRRGAGEPVAYLLGRKEFYGRDFEVGPSVLVPRPETELVVDLCKGIAAWSSQWLVADICTGCGNLGVTLCCEFPRFQCLMTDISRPALEVARRNAERLGVATRTLVSRMAFASALKPESVDLAVCNPPYVAPEEYPTLSREVADYEPRIALDGGEAGLEAPVAAVDSIVSRLRPGGYLILETGRHQAETVAGTMSLPGSQWRDVRVHVDLQGNDRCVSARRL